MSGKRRMYTPEFREQAARLVVETGRPAAHVAAEIGVGEQLLGRRHKPPDPVSTKRGQAHRASNAAQL